MMKTSITAIVLAGGESSRMGQDKALLYYSGQTLLSQICHVANECATQVYIVTPWIEKYRHIVPQNCRLISEKIILPDQRSTIPRSNSPLLGFIQGLEEVTVTPPSRQAGSRYNDDACGVLKDTASHNWHSPVKTEWILLLACDLPKLRSSHVVSWYENLTAVEPSQIALLPRSPKGWEPLCGFYRRSCLPLLQNYIATGGQSFQNFLAQHPVAELPVNDRSCLFNCNTPEEWKRAIEG